ncbi:MAG: hypothetical protein IT308_12035 [Anaerolineaceae bacterium]|nr:hypothetical protein [Anaerolineaceae bacterium]
MGKLEATTADAWYDFQQEVNEELNQTRQALAEVRLMLEQSQAELAKLTQKSQVITSRLQQVLAQFDSIPRADIKTAYHAAMDAQQRLLVMRSQLEKLQSDQAGMQKLLIFLERMQQTMLAKQGGEGTGSRAQNGVALLEMMVNAQETVRQRLSTQMHDGPAQTLSNFMIRVDIASRLMDMDINRAKEELNNLKSEATRTFSSVKAFITELRPMMLDDLGLVPTVKRYVESFKEQNNIDINLTIKGQERRLEPYLEVMIFRAIQELMGNAAKHNREHPVKIIVNVFITLEDAQVKVVVSDNGIGCKAATLDKSNGLGLKLIRERVELLGGVLDIDTFVGQGCKITFTVPCMEVQVSG